MLSNETTLSMTSADEQKNSPFGGVKRETLGSRETGVDDSHAKLAVRCAHKNLLPYVISKVPVA